ncbi:DUF2946 domain-containing protein [Paraburkholderia sp. J67]|uniref:DUF2946 domain-containing protein n=1 Tax=Paraburkholderia sp. J67 TaxID=2805435 RepID=UPI002ABDBBE3|nr:DUF2946 domain-containing protein [Paraburkholderia sp. J67]
MSLPVRTRRRLSVWLALLAMWLVVVVPVASQLIASARAASPDTASVLCSASATAGTPAASHLHLHADSLAACGYCTLLGHQPAMSAPPAAFAALDIAESAPAAPLPRAQHIPADFPSGRPRAPPAFSAFYA